MLRNLKEAVFPLPATEEHNMAYKIIDRCVCCHTCATNCPVEAITFQGSQYWIDPEVCISCGTCAPLCPPSSI